MTATAHGTQRSLPSLSTKRPESTEMADAASSTTPSTSA